MNNILWTGGWDSTFRVLDLVLLKEQEVQPFYILDRDRKSTPLELETMNKIKAMIAEVKPGAEKLIKNHILIELNEIPEDPGFTSKYNKLLSVSFLGSQYDWLGRYAKNIGLDDLELCIHKDDKAEGFIKDDVRFVVDGNDGYYELTSPPKNEALTIFEVYRFPLLSMTKVGMGEVARLNGFSHIMEETWFCFRPTKDRKPCGLCNPCKYTREEGLGRRVPNPPLYKVILQKTKRALIKIKRAIF